MQMLLRSNVASLKCRFAQMSLCSNVALLKCRFAQMSLCSNVALLKCRFAQMSLGTNVTQPFSFNSCLLQKLSSAELIDFHIVCLLECVYI
jgi:hypothetical protein